LKINRIMPFCNLFMGRPSYNQFSAWSPEAHSSTSNRLTEQVG